MSGCFYVYVLPSLLFLIFVFKWILALPAAANPRNQQQQQHQPPSPPRLPILGNLHQLGRYPHVSLRSFAQRYGPLMMVRFGSLPVLVVSSADAAREIMKTNDLIFSNRPILGAVDKLLYHGKDLSTAQYGEYWRQMRSISVLHLLSNKRVQSFKTVREEELAIFIDKIKKSSLSSSPPPVDLSEMFVTLTNDVICRVAFGRKYSGHHDEEGDQNFREVLEEFFFLLGSFNVGAFIPWLAWTNLVNGIHYRVDRVAKWFDNFLDKVIDEHMTDDRRISLKGSNGSSCEEKNKDFVDVLLEIQKHDIAGFSLDRDGIKGLILDMFAGGTDTTYTVLEWAMSELLRHPEVMAKVQNEVRQIGNGKSNISEEDLDKLHYLKAVIKETLRLYPPVPLLVPRLSTQDVRIKGYDIAAGTVVFTNAWAIGRDPGTWDAPDEFRPERFLNNAIDIKGHDFEVIPFGAGRRGCPGLSFAMVMNELVLANLVYKFNWSLPTGEDLDMTQCIGFVAHRNVHLRAVATPTFC